MDNEYDVGIVGAGIAGSALAKALAEQGLRVALLERQPAHQDLVRGEFLVPWGVAEAQRLGLEDSLFKAGAWTLRWWRQWDEIVAPDAAPAADLSDNWTPGVEGPLSLPHHRVCEEFSMRAAEAGAHVFFGVRGTALLPDRSGLSCEIDGRTMTVHASLVVGAGGRHGKIGQQAGIGVVRSTHHWGGGLAVEGLDDWPDDTLAMGTEGDVQFFVFPQGDGRARLYLNYAQETQQRFQGLDAARKFIDAFRLKCLPGSDSVVASRPAGKLACFPSETSRVDHPVSHNVVLMGDEAGMNDTVLGTGLASALRDARVLSDAVRASGRLGDDVFEPYAVERRDRMRRMHLCADLMARLYVEFGDQARERRRRALDLIADNPAHGLFLLVSMAGPEKLPDLAFAEYMADRLLAS